MLREGRRLPQGGAEQIALATAGGTEALERGSRVVVVDAGIAHEIEMHPVEGILANELPHDRAHVHAHFG